MQDRSACWPIDILRHHRQIAKVDRVRRSIENQTRKRSESRAAMRIRQAVQSARSPDARRAAERALRVIRYAFKIGAATDQHHLTPDRADEMQIFQRPANLAHHCVEALTDHRHQLRARDPRGIAVRRRTGFQLDNFIIIARAGRGRAVKALQALGLAAPDAERRGNVVGDIARPERQRRHFDEHPARIERNRRDRGAKFDERHA